MPPDGLPKTRTRSIPQSGLGQPLYEPAGAGRLSELDAIGNDELSAMAGKSTHVRRVAAFAALSAFGRWRSEGRYYRPIPSGSPDSAR